MYIFSAIVHSDGDSALVQFPDGPDCFLATDALAATVRGLTRSAFLAEAARREIEGIVDRL